MPPTKRSTQNDEISSAGSTATAWNHLLARADRRGTGRDDFAEKAMRKSPGHPDATDGAGTERGGLGVRRDVNDPVARGSTERAARLSPGPGDQDLELAPFELLG